MVGQGGAGAATALMVPSCFSSPQFEGEVDFGIWSPLLYPRLLFMPGLPLHLVESPVSPCPSSPWAAGSAASSTKHL